MHAQGMIMIVTMEEEEDQSLHDGFIDMAVMSKNSDQILFEFDDFEDVIQLSRQLWNLNIRGGSLYSFAQKYFLSFKEDALRQSDSMIAVLSEFGDISLRSIHWLEEYGRNVMSGNAIETVMEHFVTE